MAQALVLAEPTLVSALVVRAAKSVETNLISTRHAESPLIAFATVAHRDDFEAVPGWLALM